jgi:secreted PhoX family phosphatase
MLFAGGVDNPAVAGQMQGATVMNLQYQAGRWVIVAGGYQTRRIDDDTLCQITGPAADAVGTTVQGVLAPSAGCVTPWSTALLAEGDAGPWLTRLAGLGLGYDDPADAARFGWVVELNPLDPGAFPVKRTALGRFTRHGIAATVSADGRPVVFMSAAAGYLFRFLAATNATDGTALDSGALAVAVVLNGALGWAALGQDVASLAGAAGAAAQAGGTAFDGPAGIAIAADGTLYLACQGADPGNNGGIWQLTPDKGDAAAGHFTVQNILIAGKEGNYAPGSPAWFRKPRSLNIDEAGQLWIGTDQGGAGSDTADGYFMIQTGAPGPYEVSMAYLTPVGAAAGGAAFDTTSKTSFAMVRHPGAAPGASFSAPATRWPRFQPGLPPQSTLVGLISS